jgi:hypothetical protein
MDYIQKVDFIKARRLRPWDLLKGIPSSVSGRDYQNFVEAAMGVCYQNSSFVSPEEEIQFDTSYEGFYYALWRCIELAKPAKKPKSALIKKDVVDEYTEALKGVNEARLLWDDATDEEKREIRLAMNGVSMEDAIKKSPAPPHQNPEAGEGNSDGATPEEPPASTT